MLHTTITIAHAEYQKFFISFIATLIEFFHLPLPGKNSNSCLIMHYYTTPVKGWRNLMKPLEKSQIELARTKILIDHFSLVVLCKIKQISNAARFISGTAPS